MDFVNDIFHNLAFLEFYFLNVIYILLYIDSILSIFFQHSNILTRASHHWCLASNIVLVLIVLVREWSFRECSWLSKSWWRHQMETFSAVLANCAGNSPVPGEFPAEKPVTRSFDVCFDPRLNKRLSNKSWGWWFEMLSRPSWRHCNDCLKCLNVVWWWSVATSLLIASNT